MSQPIHTQHPNLAHAIAIASFVAAAPCESKQLTRHFSARVRAVADFALFDRTWYDVDDPCAVVRPRQYDYSEDALIIAKQIMDKITLLGVANERVGTKPSQYSCEEKDVGRREKFAQERLHLKEEILSMYHGLLKLHAVQQNLIRTAIKHPSQPNVPDVLILRLQACAQLLPTIEASIKADFP